MWQQHASPCREEGWEPTHGRLVGSGWADGQAGPLRPGALRGHQVGEGMGVHFLVGWQEPGWSTGQTGAKMDSHLRPHWVSLVPMREALV